MPSSSTPYPFPSPLISVATAHAFAAFFSISYVGSLYLSRTARLHFHRDPSPGAGAGADQHKKEGEEREKMSGERWRNDPDVIKARLLAASLSTALSVGVVCWLVGTLIPEDEAKRNTGLALSTALAQLGVTLDFRNTSKLSITLPCLVTPILYLGPLYADFLGGELPFQREFSFATHVKPAFFTWVGFRNHVVGPITEEVVFRACVLAVYHLAGASQTKMIFLSPLVFGVAHLHHAWDTYNRYGRSRSAARIAAVQTLFQLAYTSLFGFHCAFLLLRTGALLPSLLAHIFCNLMGLPQLGAHLAAFPARRRAIQAAYVLGVAGYVYTMRAWTRADDSLFWRAPGHVARF